MKKLLILILLIFSINAYSLNDTLYIRAGIFVTVNSDTLPAKVFTKIQTGIQTLPGPVLYAMPGESVNLVVRNMDNISHAFKINIPGWSFNQTILPGQSSVYNFTAPQTGMYLYSDPLNFPSNQSTGLFGAFIVGDNNSYTKEFIWVLSDHMISWMQNGTAGSEYYPEFSTINGKGYPDIQSDTLASINGNVGDTLRIKILNAGLLWHSMHFHGYHLNMVRKNSQYFQNPFIKDTFPVKPGDSIELLLIPDQPGMFPMHDHNNVAGEVSNNVHSRGMLILMNIQN
jgi:FtsP/CotA-like multicopper oxidase with cupredoxin domain